MFFKLPLKTEWWRHMHLGFMFSESGQTWGQNMLKKSVFQKHFTEAWSFLTCIIYSGDSINRFEVFITSDK